MAKKLKIWYDKEGDYLEVLMSDAAGYMRETDDDSILERVDENENVIGYSILGISHLQGNLPIYREIEFA